MHYTAHVDMAFASVEHIMRNVNGGWALRYIHQNGASLFFVAVYLHIFRGLYYGSYKAPREVTWIIGMLIYLMMMGTAFMGYVLPWGQMSFWGATVITGLFGAIPFVGEGIQTWLLGGPSVDNATLNRFLSLHYLLPFVILGLVIVHIWAFHTTGNNNPTGVEVRRTSRKEADADTLPFWPYFVIKDLFALAVILVVFFRDRRLHAELPRPPRQLHRGRSAGDAGAYRSRMVLLAVLRDPARLRRRRLGRDRGRVHHRRHRRCQVLRCDRHVRVDRGAGAGTVARHLLGAPRARYRPMFKWWFWIFVVNFFVLMWAGAMPAEGIYPYIALDRLGLLVRLFPRDPAASGRDREAADPGGDHSRKISTSTMAKTATGMGASPPPRRRRPSERERKLRMLRKLAISTLAAATLALSSGAALAAGGAGHVTDYDFSFEGPFGRFDQTQLQRGLQVYTQVCMACHSLQYVSLRTPPRGRGRARP